MTKKPKHDEYEDMEKTPVPQPASGEIAPGCSAPNTVPPSVVGTTHDPKKQKED